VPYEVANESSGDDADAVEQASGVNNAVARSAQLLAVAVLPVLVGLTGDAYSDAEVFARGFADAMVISVTVVASGGVLAFFVIDRPATTAPAGVEAGPGHEVGGHCDMCGPPLRQPTAARTAGGGTGGA
jgi:hypothetical protein